MKRPAVTVIKLRYQQLGQHMHVDVFMGKRVDALALTGRLVMYPEEMSALASVLELGTVNTPDVEIVWEEP
jgi:hypothetical protein